MIRELERIIREAGEIVLGFYKKDNSVDRSSRWYKRIY